MDSKDLRALHRFYDQNSNQGKSNFNGSQKNYATQWCSNVDHLNADGKETHVATLDEAKEKNKLGNVFASVDKYVMYEQDLCKLLSENVFARMFRDWNGCKFDFGTINGKRVPVLLLSFVEGGNTDFDKIERSENAVNGIERRNVTLGSNVYDQVVTRINNQLSNRHRQYVLTEKAKDLLANLFYDNIDCVKKVDNEHNVLWKQPNWDKYYLEHSSNNFIAPYGGYNPNFNVTSAVLRNIDPDKVLDLYFNHCKDADVDEYLVALKNEDKKTSKDLKCIRRITVNPNYVVTPRGTTDRVVTIECMSKKDWDLVNSMTNINREASNGIKFY